MATGPLRVDSHRFGAPGSVGGLDNAAVGAQTPVQSVKHDGYNYYQEQRMQEYVASRGNAQQHTGTNFVDTHRFGAPGTASGLVNAAGAPTTSRQGQAHGRGSTYRAPQSAPVNKISRKQEQLDFVDKHRFGAPGTVGGLDTTAGETQGQQGRQQQQQHERDFVDMDYELAWSTREQVQQGQGSNINGYRSSEGHNSQISRQRNSQQAAAENTNQRAYQEHDARDIRYNSNGPGQGGSSQAQSQVNLGVGETMASSSSGGSGATQTQVQGSVTGSGSFSANSQSSGGGGQYASSSVQGNQDGASGQAGGGLNARGSQAQVTLSRSGAGTAGSQSNFYQGGSTSNVQAGLNGGRSSSQATGLGLTNSRANIGFSENSPVTSGAPYHGGGQASAQSHGGHGQSQSQLHGRFNNGRTYSGSAQAGSGTRDAYQSQARNYNDQPNIDTRERARSSHYANYEGAQTNNVGQQSRDREIQPHQRGNEMHQTFDEDRRRHHVTSPINEVIPPQRSRSQIGAQSNPASNIQYERNDAHNSRLYHAGEDIPGFPGFEVPEGFRARVVTPETSKFYSAARGQSRAGQSIDQGAGSNVYEARLSSAAAHDTSTDASDVVEEEYYDEEYYNSDEYYSYDEDDEADFEATEGTPGSTSNQAPAGGRATDGVDQQHSQGYSPPVQVSQGAVYDALTPTPVTTTSTTTVRTEGQGDRAYSRNAHFAQGRGGNSETEARFTGSPATPSGTRAQPRNRCSTCYPISGTVSLRGDIWQFVSPQLKVNYGGSAMSQQGGQVDVRSQGGNQVSPYWIREIIGSLSSIFVNSLFRTIQWAALDETRRLWVHSNRL